MSISRAYAGNAHSSVTKVEKERKGEKLRKSNLKSKLSKL